MPLAWRDSGRTDDGRAVLPADNGLAHPLVPKPEPAGGAPNAAGSVLSTGRVRPMGQLPGCRWLSELSGLAAHELAASAHTDYRPDGKRWTRIASPGMLPERSEP
jgi:hypothetical protein